MPLRPPTSSLWRSGVCVRCQTKNFTSSARAQQIGPEHPRYIPFPEPPQQTTPYRPPIKGTLPVPRDVFRGRNGTLRASKARIASATPQAQEPRRDVPKGSREEWERKMATARKNNLREGLKGLLHRRSTGRWRDESRRQAVAQDDLERRLRPEREDERLTTPSHGLDLETLFHGKLQDPNREERVAAMRQRYQRKETKKSDARKDDLQTLYMNARSFIVTPEQLDSAIETAFGTDENPVAFGDNMGPEDPSLRSDSVWTYGAPNGVQDKLNLVNRARGKTATATEGSGGYSAINKERIRRIAEGLTGGKMDDLTE